MVSDLVTELLGSANPRHGLNFFLDAVQHRQPFEQFEELFAPHDLAILLHVPTPKVETVRRHRHVRRQAQTGIFRIVEEAYEQVGLSSSTNFL